MSHPLSLRIVVGFSLAFTGNIALADICRVTPEGSIANDGESWATAMNLRMALFNPACTEVWVKRGRYIPTPEGGADPYFQIQPGQAVYGGFAGTETTRNQRRPAQYRSVLSGDLDGNDIVDSNGITSHWNNIVGSNACQVVRMTGPYGVSFESDTVLDGLTITGGSGSDNEDDPICNGAGLYCLASSSGACSPTLRNLDIVGNSAFRGAGMWFGSSSSNVISPRIASSRFRNNRATNEGGALHLQGSPKDLTNSPVILDSSFVGNQADAGGGAIYVDPFAGYATTVTITRSVFDDNHSNGDGGAITVSVWADGIGDIRISDSTFRNNSAQRNCGALEFNGWSSGTLDALLDGVTLHDNSAVRNGGAVCATETGATQITLTLRNTTVANNHAAIAGGGWYNAASDTSAIAAEAINTTFSGNQAGTVGGAIRNVIEPGGVFGMTLTNSILWHNQATTSHPDLSQDSTGLAIRRTLIEQGCPFMAAPCDRVPGDPKLLPLSANGGPTLTMWVPADGAGIDQGDAAACPSHDQRGVPRPQGAGCDLGAVEWSDLIFADGFQSP